MLKSAVIDEFGVRMVCVCSAPGGEWLCFGPIPKTLHFGLSSAQLCTFKLSVEKQLGRKCQLKSPTSFITH